MPPILTTTAASSFAARTWPLKAEQRTNSAAIAVRLIAIRIFLGGFRFWKLCEKLYVILYKGAPIKQLRSIADCGAVGQFRSEASPSSRNRKAVPQFVIRNPQSKTDHAIQLPPSTPYVWATT